MKILTVTLVVGLASFTSAFYDTDRGPLMQNAILKYGRDIQDTCLLGGRRELVHSCHVPSGQHVRSEGGQLIRYPRNSICHLKAPLPTVDRCIVCRGGSWDTSDCTPAPRREKRFLFLIPFVICWFFCNRGSGGQNQDFKPPSFTSCEKPSPIFYADRGKTSTIVSWPVPTATDGKGKEISPVLTQGNGTPDSEFEAGFYYFVYKATDERGFSDYCQFSFEVKVRKCTLNWIRHGNRQCSNSNYIYGTTCSVVCDDGYDIDGANEITCEEDGWDATVPSCKSKLCPSLPAGFQCTNTRKYGSICSLTCDRNSGQSVTNPSITICLQSGNWLTPIPQCVDSSSPVFNNCPVDSVVEYAGKGQETTSVTWDDVTATDNSGRVTVTQTEGLPSGSMFPKGTSIVRYKALDAGGNEAVCSFSVVVQVLTCGPPPYTDNALRFNCTNQFLYGSQCAVTCVGALLNGSNSISCEKDTATPPQMQWQTSISQPPICIRAKCPDLDAPANGALACDSNFAGSFCTMHCNNNWDIPITAPSRDMYMCGWTSGTWFPSSDVPDCTEKHVPTNIRLPSLMYYYMGDCSNPRTQERIKEAHVSIVNGSALFFSTGCISTGVCSVDAVEITCGTTTRRRRDVRYTDVEGSLDGIGLRRHRREENVAIVTWEWTVKYECGSMGTTECVEQHVNILNEMRDEFSRVVGDGEFSINVTGVMVHNDSYVPGVVELECEEGAKPVFSTGSCAVCPTGTLYNRTSSSCINCPVGTYQDENHSFSCKACPSGTTTLSPGARNESFCQEMCVAGEISVSGVVPCSLCPLGQYQTALGSTSCLTCPTGTTTQQTGTSSVSGCQSYDLDIKGPIQLASSRSITDVMDSFTLLVWVKFTSTPDLRINIGTNQLALEMTTNLSVHLHGSESISGISLETNKWISIGVTFDFSSKVLHIYKGGDSVSMTTLQSMVSPVIANASSLTVNSTSVLGVQIRALTLRNVPKTSSEMTAMAGTCDLIRDDNIVITSDDLTGGTSDKVKVIVPSSCDAVDECETNPCNGHPCINAVDSFKCQCQDGYTGSDCTTPPDFCVSSKCENEATCVSREDNYTCTCPRGFKGTLCEISIVHGGYSNWTEWSACPVSCGGGIETRSRRCDNPPPDVDGDPCSGHSLENRDCNQDPCPVCSSSQLKAGANNSMQGPECIGDVSELQCTVRCQPGFYLSRDQVATYNCSNGQWAPSTQLPSCLEIISPKNLTLKSKVNFTNTGCLSQNAAADLKADLSTRLQTLECSKLANCTPSVTVNNCDSDGDSITVDVTFTVVLPEGRMELDSPETEAVVEAIRTLEETARQLQNDSNVLQVTSGGVTYTPSSDIDVEAVVTCQPGYFAEDGLCGPCPAGTYYDEFAEMCEFCRRGSYQDMTGQQTCKDCTEGLATEFIGSTDESACNVLPTTPSTKTTSSSARESTSVESTSSTSTSTTSVSKTTAGRRSSEHSRTSTGIDTVPSIPTTTAGRPSTEHSRTSTGLDTAPYTSTTTADRPSTEHSRLSTGIDTVPSIPTTTAGRPSTDHSRTSTGMDTVPPISTTTADRPSTDHSRLSTGIDTVPQISTTTADRPSTEHSRTSTGIDTVPPISTTTAGRPSTEHSKISTGGMSETVLSIIAAGSVAGFIALAVIVGVCIYRYVGRRNRENRSPHAGEEILQGQKSQEQNNYSHLEFKKPPSRVIMPH